MWGVFFAVCAVALAVVVVGKVLEKASGKFDDELNQDQDTDNNNSDNDSGNSPY